MTKLIIDCDTGRDDAIALWCLHKLNRELSAVVASYGNVEREQVIENTMAVLGFAGLTPKIFSGAARPDQDHPLTARQVSPRQKSIGNGLCNLRPPSLKPQNQQNVQPLTTDALIHLGPFDYCILGPATSLAQHLQEILIKAPETLHSVTMMGGRFGELWENKPESDFNIACDPYAVQALLDSEIKPRFVSLNTTWDIALKLEEIRELVPRSTLGEFAQKLMITHCQHFSPEPIFRFHDPAVIWAIQHPDLFEDVYITVNTDPKAKNFGQLQMLDDVQPNARIFPSDKALALEIKNWILKQIDLD